MKKSALQLILLSFFVLFSHYSQGQLKLQAGMIIPVGDDIHETGYGGALGYDAKIGPGLTVGGSLGVYHYPGKSFGFGNFSDQRIIPFLATFSKGFGVFYTGLDVGINSVDGDQFAPAVIPKMGAKISKFSFEVRYSALPTFEGGNSTYLNLLAGVTF